MFLSLCRAQSLSPTDHLAAFYLAMQLAVSRQVAQNQHICTHAHDLKNNRINQSEAHVSVCQVLCILTVVETVCVFV